MDESRVAMLAGLYGIRQKRDDGGIAKTFAALSSVALTRVHSRGCGNSDIAVRASYEYSDRTPGCRQRL